MTSGPKAEDAGKAATEPDASTATNEPAPPSVIKKWILPTGNGFIEDASRKFAKPEGNLGDGVAYVQPGFDDSTWRQVKLPHDWAIEGPFTAAGGGGMGPPAQRGSGLVSEETEHSSIGGRQVYLP